METARAKAFISPSFTRFNKSFHIIRNSTSLQMFVFQVINKRYLKNKPNDFEVFVMFIFANRL
jgi:hypothetical protein